MGGDQTLISHAGDVRQRLSAGDLAAGGLLAASHVHRYEFAAALCRRRRVLDLCCGTGYGSRLLASTAAAVHGVDVAEDAVAAAREALDAGQRERVTFEVADALACLRALPQGAHDAVVCFEGIEHVSDPEALIAELARLAAGGARLVLSLPNSKGFGEENPFHVSEFGYEEMRVVVERLPGSVVLSQRLAEASVIAPAEAELGVEHVTGRLEAVADGEEWANHWIVVVNAPADELRDASARLTFVAAPQASAYMRTLEQSNAELLRINVRLARGWLGMYDAAAGSVMRRLEEQTTKAEHWKRIADHNDWARRGLERRLQTRRHRLVDWPRDTWLAVAGLVRASRRRRPAERDDGAG